MVKRVSDHLPCGLVRAKVFAQTMALHLVAVKETTENSAHVNILFDIYFSIIKISDIKHFFQRKVFARL